ncbi:MAG: DUF47 family protein [bacterium]
MGFKEWIIPQDRIFYDLLEKHIGLAATAAQQFKSLLGSPSWANVEVWREKIKETENQADATGHEIFERLNATFITPIDREDLARLAHAVDDITDAIYGATNRIALYRIAEPTPTMHEFIGIIDAQVKELSAGIFALRKPGQLQRTLSPHVVEIHRLENVADRLLNKAVAELFTTNDAVRIMKYKEIYEFLEAGTDRCEDVADVLHDILRKHS